MDNDQERRDTHPETRHTWREKPLGFVFLSRIRDWWVHTPPDPWDAEIDVSVRRDDAVMVCHRCCEPREFPRWFCPNCGAAIGPYNNVLPYIYVFSIGEVVRSGVGPHARFTPLTLSGYAAVGLLQYQPLAILYVIRLVLNYRRLAKERTHANHSE